ncbi:Gfo/Idh/MocA family protein [Haloarchaeobius amylolyticus]|uniref:Gfo/Idh/MocA family protein n=1 Tax=Haloarchaeobius amylolyticus TaxID=1198296 RepID=UPI002270C40B|nr:Gfo/Idh/MocA family oxidoreductase [Haloarchaeobius amylolyticus]
MTVSLGIIGTGGFGSYFGRQLKAVDDADIVSIADVSDENRTRAGEELGVPDANRYVDYELMLADAPLDGVVISTPHTLHYEMITAAMDEGLHVMCEKPLTTDLEQARDLVERADASDTLLMVGYQRHLSPAFLLAKERLEAIEPTFITAEITQNWLTDTAETWRQDPALSGGGQLYDTGSHLVDAVLWTTGLTPQSVSASMVFVDEAERVDVQAVLNVEFENGGVASLSVSGDAPRVSEHIRVWGEGGGVRVDGTDWDDREVSFVDPDGTEVYPSEEGIEDRNRAEAFVDAIVHDEEPPATPRDALAVTALTEAAYESAKTGETVEIDLGGLV